LESEQELSLSHFDSSNATMHEKRKNVSKPEIVARGEIKPEPKIDKTLENKPEVKDSEPKIELNPAVMGRTSEAPEFKLVNKPIGKENEENKENEEQPKSFLKPDDEEIETTKKDFDIFSTGVFFAKKEDKPESVQEVRLLGESYQGISEVLKKTILESRTELDEGAKFNRSDLQKKVESNSVDLSAKVSSQYNETELEGGVVGALENTDEKSFIHIVALGEVPFKNKKITISIETTDDEQLSWILPDEELFIVGEDGELQKVEGGVEKYPGIEFPFMEDVIGIPLNDKEGHRYKKGGDIDEDKKPEPQKGMSNGLESLKNIKGANADLKPPFKIEGEKKEAGQSL
jgi:hypothetical protein